MSDKKLWVSEMYHSIQGEGVTTGVPSIFLRTKACNLNCNFCDSLEVWKKGDPWDLDDLVAEWEKKGWLDTLSDGRTHLVVTGGEPLLQQEALGSFLSKLTAKVDPVIHVEVETAATIIPDPNFDLFVFQYNVSPKLMNSGNHQEKRYKPEVLKWFSDKGKSWFKFVVTTAVDVGEILEGFILPFEIPRSRVFLMPEGSTPDELDKKSKWVAEACKRFGFRFSDRLHIRIWGKTTGV